MKFKEAPNFTSTNLLERIASWSYEAMGHDPGRHRNMPQNTDLIIFLKKIVLKSTGSNFCKNGSKIYQK